MATGQLDIPRLSSFCSLPQATLTSLLEAPTCELVRTLLQNLGSRIREHDELKSDKLKLNVELENAVRGGESKSRVLKNSVDKGLREAAELRQKLQEAEQAKAKIESDFEALKSSTSDATSEITSLKTRVTSLEASNRDTLSLLESKSTSYDQLTEELTSQHQKTIELRKQVSSLEQRVQSAEATVSTANYHEQSLQSEIEQLKRNNDWLDRELKAKADEFAKYRKDRGSRVSDLQRQNDEATNTIEAARRMEQTLRNRIDELGQKADDYLTRIQQMSEEAARAEEFYKKTVDSKNRIIELTQSTANTDKARLQELQEELEATRDNAQDEINKLISDVQEESEGRERAEQRVAELEAQVEKLEAEVTELRHQVLQGGPLHDGTNGQPGMPGRAMSPASSLFSPGRARLKGGLSTTQLYSENNELKSQNAGLRREVERLSSSVDEMLQDAEAMRPEIDEVRTENAKLESTNAELSSLVDQMGKERDQAVKNARKAAGQNEAKARENEVLRQQLRDLSAQVKILLFEIDRREKGMSSFTADQQSQLEQLARGESDSADVTDTDRFIAAELVMFRSVAELQEQNEKMLTLTRELGGQLEREEAARNQNDYKDFKKLYEDCQHEIQSLLTQSQSYVQERDMFRRMLTHRGQLPREGEGDYMFTESVNEGVTPATPSQARVINSVEQSPNSKDISDYTKLLKELQTHFDNYKKEAATDHTTLRSQVDKLSTANGELRTEVLGKNSQLAVASERYQMLQSNYAMLKNENNELQKRSQFFSDNAAKQDLRTQQVAEDLIEAKGLLDSMRNENANLRAEKEFFKTIEKRLTADNEAQFSEKARLNNLNVSLQKLINEREQTDAETRRRLQSRIESLEQELQTTKQTLSEQNNENKRASDRYEYDKLQNQKKIDDLLTSLSAAREELAAAKTSRDHLQARVDELTIQLRSAEERVQLLLSASPSRLVNGNQEPTQGNGETEQTSSSQGQELAFEISELKRDLDLKKRELREAKEQVENYKIISQRSEEALQSLNDAQDKYRQEMDKIIEEKDAKINELEQRISDIHAEMTSTNTELTDLRNKEAEIDRQLQEQKSSFEREIAKLKDQDERHATAAQYHQEDLRAQAEIAQQAQQNYENELVKHAEAAKTLQKVRSDSNDLKVQMVEMKTELESARTSLTQSEESWKSSKARYEQELTAVREGKQSLAEQNNRLHQQLEDLTKQISNLRKLPEAGGSDQPEDQHISSGLENLQEVIRYLRTEKQIIDYQLVVSVEDNKRLQQQLDLKQSELDAANLRVDQQRQLDQDTERSALDHKKIMDELEQLNTLRESNATLRSESRQARTALALKTQEVEELVAQVEPLQAQLRDLTSQVETQAGEARLLQEDRNRWRQRTQDILQKYDRVDPAELEALKTQVQTLQTERDELVSSKQSLQEQVNGIDAQITQVQEQNKERVEELKARLTEQFKTRSKNLTGTIREKDASLQTATKEKQDLEERLAEMQQNLDQAKAEREQAVTEAAAANSTAPQSNSRPGSEDGQVDEEEAPKVAQSDFESLQEKLSTAETKLNEETSRNAELQNEIAAAQSKISELEGRIQEVQQKLDVANAELVQLQAQASQTEARGAANAATEEEVDRLRHELEQAQQDANNLRAAASIQASSPEFPGVEGGKSVTDQLSEMRAAIQAELEARHNERVQKAEALFKQRTETMKNQLTKKLTESKEQVRREKEEALLALRIAHEQEMEELKRRHQNELDELKRQEESKFADFKNTWLAEQESKTAATESTEKTGAPKTEAPKAGPSWEPSDSEARDFVASNATVRGILTRNIQQKVGEARTALTSQLKEEHAKDLTAKLEEAQTKANVVREQAVVMEGKKNTLKVTILENKAKLAQLRLDIVAKAANDTPSKPVVEVWEIAKGAKPANSASQQSITSPSPSAQGPPRFGSISQASSSQQPAPGSPKTQKPLQTGSLGQPAPVTALQQPQTRTPNAPKPAEQFPPAPSNAANQEPSQNGNQPANQAKQPAGQPTPTPTQSLAEPEHSKPSASTNQRLNPPQLPSTLPPNQQAQGQANNHPNAGTGPAALRGLHQSGLPVARGGNANRAGGARGRGNEGRGRGRGAPQSMNTHPAQSQHQAAPSPTQMSGAAKQFVPQGNKRPREDGEGGGQRGDFGGNGKRIRGGAGGA
ncbi:MAG: hypothetical protein LQ346_004979 [Caloplaca aetnensis]|nr:MAG: hypothetical protein LQ346_004979 [Caloplaca aetnensis]